MSTNIKQRSEIPDEYKWDIEDMYASDEQWEADLKDGLTLADQLSSYEGRLGEDAQTLLAALKLQGEAWQKLERVFVYARMRRDEDNRVEKYQSMADRAMAALAQASANTAFFTPELLSYEKEDILRMTDELDELKIYRFMLEDTFRQKEHVLSAESENLLAQMSEVTQATSDIFTMLNNADIKFGTITDEDGNNVEMSHGNYIKFMQSKDRSVRKAAYEAMYNAFSSLINTIASNYNYNTKNDVISARIRKYPSARSAALSGDNIPGDVYDSLVSAVNDNLPVLHRYMELRKRLLDVDELKMYDIYAPLIDVPERKIPYEEALKMIREALAPMGSDYLEIMNRGFAEGWADVYENEGKTSGAYSFGSYDSKPYMLLNYTDTLNDVFTVIHEMGHSMHAYYTRKTQPFIYGSHSIFTAEVASTVNENLLMKHLIANESDPEMKKYLIAKHIEDFRTTLFRQTMFAEFEDMTHKAVEAGETLTAGWLCEKYNELNSRYFGPALSEDDLIKYEWARIPHFYSAFYVYKYATGYSAASAISDIILKDGPDDYLRFLTTGESDHPIELLKIAGVDMSSPEPVNNAMKTFAALVGQLEELTK